VFELPIGYEGKCEGQFGADNNNIKIEKEKKDRRKRMAVLKSIEGDSSFVGHHPHSETSNLLDNKEV